MPLSPAVNKNNIEYKVISSLSELDAKHRFNDFKEFIPVKQFVNTNLDHPDQIIDAHYFSLFQNHNQQQNIIYDIMLAHSIIESGVPNKFKKCIPLCTAWNIKLLEMFHTDYEDREVVDWLTYGFLVSRNDSVAKIEPADHKHNGVNLFPQHIHEYIDTELKYHATMGPFAVLPFIGEIRISPLSTRPKKDSGKRRVILDLSFPFGNSVNDP